MQVEACLKTEAGRRGQTWLLLPGLAKLWAVTGVTSPAFAPPAHSTICGQEWPWHVATMNMEPSTPSHFPKQVSSLRIMSAAFPDKTSRNTRVTDVP